MSIEKMSKVIEHLKLLGNWEMDPLDETGCVWHELRACYDFDFTKYVDVSEFKFYSGEPRYPVNGRREFDAYPDLTKWSNSRYGKMRRNFCIWLAFKIEELNAFALGCYDRQRKVSHLRNRFSETSNEEAYADWREGWCHEDDARRKA